MTNYFYHPLGDYAENYISGSASTGALPHTYSSHGFSKIDFGVGAGLPVYSMSNGIISSCGDFSADGVSKYGCVIKTTDCGYSRMQAALQGGTAEDYPVYFTYIEMDSIESGLKPGDIVQRGQQIGTTNKEYTSAASNLHFDIQPFDRYHTAETPDKAKQWYGAISLTQFDAYGDKGEGYKLSDHLDSNFTPTDGGIKDHAGKFIGVKSSDGKYYPPNSGGTPITTNTGLNEGNLDPSLEIGKWYSHLFMMQTPIKVENKQNTSNSDLSKGWHKNSDSSSYRTTGIHGWYSSGIGGRKFTVYSQNAGEWQNGGHRFWNNSYSGAGCGPTSTATIISGYKEGITPLNTGEGIKKTLTSEYGGSYDGALWAAVLKELNKNGVPSSAASLGSSSLKSTMNKSDMKSKIISSLTNGKPVIVNVKPGANYGPRGTSGGHFFTLLDYDSSNGKAFIGDPAGSMGSCCNFFPLDTILSGVQAIFWVN